MIRPKKFQKIFESVMGVPLAKQDKKTPKQLKVDEVILSQETRRVK